MPATQEPGTAHLDLIAAAQPGDACTA